MLHLGITGGIGSGKTTVCKIFETLGIPVYYADDRAKWLMVNDSDLKNEIIALFGVEAYLEDGALNRKFIAQQAFNNKNLLNQLNSIVHPAVGRDSLYWQDNQQAVPYTLKEAALIFESGSFKELDKIITVFAPKELRIQRILKRDQTSREAIEARMSKQLPEEEKIKRADFVIYNDGQQPLIQQVLEIHQALLSELKTIS